ncbi:MAG: CBS domain-containing protein [Desulfobacterales bacterium]|jgi:predicted transcriptional regulator
MLTARDVMVTSFDTIHQEASIDEAIKSILKGKVRKTGHKTISLIVVDDYGQMTGVITMYDILYHLRPDFLNFGLNADEFPWTGQLNKCINAIKAKKVQRLMSGNVMGAKLDDHIMVILDHMIKNRYRRLPVLERNKPIGILYISDIFDNIFK